MSSIIKVNTYQDANGNALFSSDGSGNVTLNSNFSAVLPNNTPSFFAWENTNGQSLTASTETKINFDQEVYDTDNAYDTSTSKFTVPTGKGGKYFIYSTINLSTDSNNGDVLRILVYKNGSRVVFTNNNQNTSGNFRHFQQQISVILDLSAGDYIEIYGYSNGTSPYIQAGSADYETYFMGYKIIGA